MERETERKCLLLYVCQLSFFIHTAWQSSKPLNKLGSKTCSYNNAQTTQPISTAEEWFLSPLIWIVATAWLQLVQPPCIRVASLCFSVLWVRLEISIGPLSPLGVGEGARSRKHWGCSLDLELYEDDTIECLIGSEISSKWHYKDILVSLINTYFRLFYLAQNLKMSHKNRVFVEHNNLQYNIFISVKFIQQQIK